MVRLHRLVLLSLCGEALARNNSLGRLPPLGWNTWCTWSSCHQNRTLHPEYNLTTAYHDVCTEAMVKDVAQSMLDQGLHAAGYTRVNLDDCWEATTRDPASGATRADPARFPSGTLKPLADWLHARNFSFGMYTSAGNETCSTGGRAIPGEPRARGVSGSWGHYAQDAATYASWGVDFVKLDWCIRDPSVSREARTTAFAAALDGSGREMWLNFHCEGAFQDWCARDGNSWRISEDHHDIWSNTAGVIEALATVNQRNQTGPHRWADPDFLMTGGAGCDTNETAKRCPGQTEAEYRTEMSLWTLGAAQILVATDLRQLTPFMREVLLHEEMLAIHQDALARPGGRVAYVDCDALGGGATGHQHHGSAAPAPAPCSVKLEGQISHSACVLGETFGCYGDVDNRTMWTSGGCRGTFECDGVKQVECNVPQVKVHEHATCNCAPGPLGASKCQVWARALQGDAVAVGLYNADGAAHNMTIDIRATLTAVGRSGGAAGSVVVRDVWQRAALGVYNGSFTAKNIASHATEVFLFVPSRS